MTLGVTPCTCALAQVRVRYHKCLATIAKVVSNGQWCGLSKAYLCARAITTTVSVWCWRSVSANHLVWFSHRGGNVWALHGAGINRRSISGVFRLNGSDSSEAFFGQSSTSCVRPPRAESHHETVLRNMCANLYSIAPLPGHSRSKCYAVPST